MDKLPSLFNRAKYSKSSPVKAIKQTSSSKTINSNILTPETRTILKTKEKSVITPLTKKAEKLHLSFWLVLDPPPYDFQ